LGEKPGFGREGVHHGPKDPATIPPGGRKKTGSYRWVGTPLAAFGRIISLYHTERPAAQKTAPGRDGEVRERPRILSYKWLGQPSRLGGIALFASPSEPGGGKKKKSPEAVKMLWKIIG
jgi:hypothetical protein